MAYSFEWGPALQPARQRPSCRGDPLPSRRAPDEELALSNRRTVVSSMRRRSIGRRLLCYRLVAGAGIREAIQAKALLCLGHCDRFVSGFRRA